MIHPVFCCDTRAQVKPSMSDSTKPEDMARGIVVNALSIHFYSIVGQRGKFIPQGNYLHNSVF